MSDPTPNITFIVGASGSGTTLLTRLLASPPNAEAVGGNHISIPESNADAHDIISRFIRANTTAWDRRATIADHEAARAEQRRSLDDLLALPALRERGIDHIIFKRSIPFLRGDQHRPDLRDLLETFPQANIIAIFRDPRASTASSLRRKFGTHLRECAVITEESLTYLAAQLAAIPEDRAVIFNYEQFCLDPSPHLDAIAALTNLSAAALLAAAEAESITPLRTAKWREELPPGDVAFLDAHFTPARCAQWPLLNAHATQSPSAASQYVS